MPMYEKVHLKNMPITIEELGNKHQLNTSNVGILRIDDCLAYSESSGIFRCDLLSIRQDGMAPIQFVECRCGNSVIMTPVSMNTEILSVGGNYVSLANGTLKKGIQLLVVSGNASLRYSVTQVIGGNNGYVYKIRTSRNNYVLENGLVIKSD